MENYMMKVDHYESDSLLGAFGLTDEKFEDAMNFMLNLRDMSISERLCAMAMQFPYGGNMVACLACFGFKSEVLNETVGVIMVQKVKEDEE